MLIGGLIYILFRSEELLMFTWFKTAGVYNSIIEIRDYSNTIYLPNWIIHSLPDGIWIYSLTSFMILIWGPKIDGMQSIWLFIGPILGIGAELGQYLKIVPGTYDMIDLLFCIIASFSPFLILKRNKTN